ncbi:hypothetical protein MKW94_013209 [Papaver nudicaule]|uniref:tRNA(adenine(34)) deaminase n=1 Tax=Papaver nudicaule TaxID=74823 RepID=A0AA41V6I6_PAPNU|nr:hypothetical protein [Papaver nudicaule]
MYNIYSSSTVGIRSKSSLCLSINDYYLSNEKCPSSLCSPCSCCSVSIYGYGVPMVNPRFLYGFRQSSLIHCSASRKLILGGGGCSTYGYNPRLPVCYSDSISYGDSYHSLKEKSRPKERESGIARRGRRFVCMAWEEKSEDFDMCSDGNVEAMLSLLTEDISESIVDIERRKNRSRTVGFQGETRSRVSECVNEGNKYVDSGSSEGNSKCSCQSVRVKPREEGSQHSGGMKSSLKRVDNGGVRKERLTRSSCYSEGVPVESKRERRGVNKHVKEEKKYIECGSLERNSMRESESESVKIKLREEGSSRDEHLDSKKKRSSSTSSNFSGRYSKDIRHIDVNECTKEERKYVESGSLEKISNREYGVVTNKSREEGRTSSGEMGVSTRGDGENRGLRKEGSSCSSYYSAVSSGDIDETHESNTVGQVQHERFGGEPSSSYRNQKARQTEEGLFTDDAKKQHTKYESDGWRYVEASRKGRTLVGRDEISIGVDGALRKDEQESLEVKDRASCSQERSGSEESNLTPSIDIVQNTRNERSGKGYQVVEQSRTKLQQQTQMSDIQNKANRSAYSSQNRLSERDEKITEAVNLLVEARERYTRVDNQIIDLSESTKKSQQVSQISGIHSSDTRWSSNLQGVHETKMKNREEDSSSLKGSFQEVKEQHTQADQEVGEIAKSWNESHSVTNVLVTSALDAEFINSSQKLPVTRVSTQEENSTSHVDMALEAREPNQMGQRVIGQVRSMKESQKPSRTSSFRESSNEEGSSSQTALNLVHQQQLGAQKVDRRNLQVMVTPPSSQLVRRDSTETLLNRRPSNHSAIREDFPQEEVPASFQELDGGTRTDEIYTEHSNLAVNEDALASANRLEASSTMFVGEFMEKLRGEASTSEFVEGRTSSQSNQQVSEDLQSQVHSSMRSSSLSGRKGPSDDMWQISGASKIEAPIEAKSMKENMTVRGTKRSLWSIVSDIVRVRWGARSETPNSTSKFGGRSSPNESGVSEAWFSSNEPDENDDENAKKSKRSTPKRSRSADLTHPRKTPTQTQGDAYEVMVSHENLMEGEAYATSSSNGRSFASKVVSSASNEDTFNSEEGVNTGQGTPPSIIGADPSIPLLKRRLIRSPPVEAEILESNIEVPRKGSEEMVDKQLRERPAEAMGSGRKDGDSKQKKFERNKQVPKDRFEEWEEAYIIESEQKKMDEMFMREALLEAKKAADTWEVPVGAVLVHNGKIIARGCNLVEELRDSTAHAEMICIREASNVLRTWRLAETTLYVTLEPCAMCAGAILQARVATVVWGAPNKLLGADGSWVRLFPTASEGQSSSDLTNQPIGPVHPFHPKMTIRRGILSTECADIMQQFFQLRRKTKEKKSDSPVPPPSCLPIASHPSKIITKMHDVFHLMFCL